MNYLEYIPSLWLRFRDACIVYTRILKYNLFATDLHIYKFTYHAINSKGLLIVHYHCTGLIYFELFNRKYLKPSGTIVLNLGNLTTTSEIKISFKGRRYTKIEAMVINDLIHTDFKKIYTEIKLDSLLMEDFKLVGNRKSLPLKINRSALTLNTPKLKFR